MLKNKWGDKLLLIGVAAILLFGSVGLCAFPTARFSATENRLLAAFPTFSAESLANGTYTAALDDYATERVPFRGICRCAYAASELVMGHKESHGVILCRDGSLCRRAAVDEQIYAQNLRALSRLQGMLGDLPLTVAVAPRRIDVRNEVLPVLYDTARERHVWQQVPAGAVTFLDATDDAQWYRTDHHWTAEGAYFAYVRLSRYLGYAPRAASDFTPTTVSQSFLGTSAAAAGLAQITPDTVQVWRYEQDTSYRVIRDGKPSAFTGLYDPQKLSGADHYSFFLGGNCGILQIDRGDGDTRPLLFVVKDSFANSLLPFLAQHYRILAIDPRYYTGALQPLLKNVDTGLVLCGMQTLTGSPFLSLLR
jgi:hypothetical protein